LTKPVGKTKDVGFQFGIQKTFSISELKAWDFMFSDKGLKIWLGPLQSEFAHRLNFKTNTGVEGFVRVFKPYSHVRLHWKRPEWHNMSTVQVRVMGKSNGRTTISFHQEKLLDSDQREEMKKYWNHMMEQLSEHIEKSIHD
jgi:hypothetical protein